MIVHFHADIGVTPIRELRDMHSIAHTFEIAQVRDFVIYDLFCNQTLSVSVGKQPGQEESPRQHVSSANPII